MIAFPSRMGLFAACLLAACTSSQSLETRPAQPVVVSEPHMLGETEVQIRITQFGTGYTLVAPHANEQTSIAAAKIVLPYVGGKLVEVVHAGGRNVAFTQGGVRHTFDPNRIFTDGGIRQTLGATYSAEAHQSVKGFANALLAHIKGPTVIALHNNTDGGYSLASYQAGERYARDASEVHVVEGVDHDNFFFTTSSLLFETLKAQGQNIVLQSADVTDDGSLSVFCARVGIPYVNVEAQHGHQEVQKQMLEALLR